MASVYLTIRPQEQEVTHKWKTGIQRTVKGAEKRSALFTWPRVNLQQTYPVVRDKAINWLKRNLITNTDKIWGVPIWADETALTAQADSGQNILTVGETDYRHFYDGGECIIIDPDDPFEYEVATISGAITSTQLTLQDVLVSTWAVNSVVLPIYECRVKQGQEILADYPFYQTFELAAEEAYEEDRSNSYTLPSSGADTYLSIDVFRTEFLAPIEYTFQRDYEALQFLGKGYSYPVLDDGDNVLGIKASIMCDTKEDMWKVIQFFDSKQGRFERFWMPSWNNDIVVNTAIDWADLVIYIDNIEYTTHYLTNDIIGRYIYVQFPDGSYVCRNIVDSDGISITLDSYLGVSVSAGELAQLKVCFLYLMRFSIDEITITYPSNKQHLSQTDLSFAGLIKEVIT